MIVQLMILFDEYKFQERWQESESNLHECFQ